MSQRIFTLKKNTSVFNPKPVVTYKWCLNLAKAAVISLLLYFRLPGRLQFSCTLAWSCTSQAYNSFISSPLIILQLWRIINNRHTLSCPVTPDALTVKGIPGDLTSHGWMQGAFTSPSNCDLDPQYSHSASRPQQRHYMDTTLFTHAQGGEKESRQWFSVRLCLSKDSSTSSSSSQQLTDPARSGSLQSARKLT